MITESSLNVKVFLSVTMSLYLKTAEVPEFLCPMSRVQVCISNEWTILYKENSRKQRGRKKKGRDCKRMD